ncbi:ABC transporter ATP-binding protein uup [Candidatus Bealeia paramacronuclearis]|uniref:ABC transporter ATP-binding protein uup n=1 Tax=Candidatus Bealeia paramacronuclearis TaxID=1921001 RepID=A0ABZ2C5F4_9PROT|nr:ABC transporter ATP-binding protein uup [Candidatus Bealeia paramacronuclearis]
MSYTPILFKSLGLAFSKKICFENFNATLYEGDRIAIIGRNGAGKSTLLKMILGEILPSLGEIRMSEYLRIGYVPQIVEDHSNLSGGQRFHKAFTDALAQGPQILLLDEPTNHLDSKNRKSLMRMLSYFPGTLIIVSHDVELLNGCVNQLWHIDQERIHIFKGHYEDYLLELGHKRAHLEEELVRLNRLKREAHLSLMKEQNRGKTSRLQGEKHITQRKWPTVVSNAKANRAAETVGAKTAAIREKKAHVSESLQNLRLPEILKPKFSIKSQTGSSKVILSIQEGGVGYEEDVLKNLNLSLNSQDRLAILGANGSGKTTLIKAILNDTHVQKSGEWLVPKVADIGYLDQHYGTLIPHKTVLEIIQARRPDWSHAEARNHLNDFLFRKNEEVNATVETLSGGEKARLSLAQIAAQTPRLLILDELTNNLDVETRDHVIQVLKAYPGALMIISHDEDFLSQIGILTYYDLDEI